MSDGTREQDLVASGELRQIHADWGACNDRSAAMLYLRASLLRREPLKPEHNKRRLRGHWDSDARQLLPWVHLNRLSNFHSYTLLLHKLTCKRTYHANLHGKAS